MRNFKIEMEPTWELDYYVHTHITLGGCRARALESARGDLLNAESSSDLRSQNFKQIVSKQFANDFIIEIEI